MKKYEVTNIEILISQPPVKFSMWTGWGQNFIILSSYAAEKYTIFNIRNIEYKIWRNKKLLIWKSWYYNSQPSLACELGKVGKLYDPSAHLAEHQNTECRIKKNT